MNDDAAVRFEQYTIRTEGCWHWTGSPRGGYGRIRDGGRTFSAHRASYEHFVGPVPSGLTLDHTCRNKLCVNPAHLEPVTMRENTLRADSPVAKNARATSCVYGHPLSGDNLIAYSNGKRGCRECRRLRSRRLYYANHERNKTYYKNKAKEYRSNRILSAALNAVDNGIELKSLSVEAK